MREADGEHGMPLDHVNRSQEVLRDMRFTKAMGSLALAVGLLAIAALPSMASADWTTEGSELTGSTKWVDEGVPLEGGATVSLAGSFRFSGGIECEVNGSLTLEPGAKGQVTEFSADPEGCTPAETLANVCQEVTSMSPKGLPWSAEAVETKGGWQVQLSGVETEYGLKGGIFCPAKMALSGDLTATPDDRRSIASLDLSGPVSTSYGSQEVEGSLSVSPAGRYGVVDDGGSIGASGTLAFNGGVSCSVDAGLLLEPGTSGLMNEIAWSDCKLTESLASTCSKVTKVVASDFPWTIHDTGSAIEVQSVDFTYYLEGGPFCPSARGYTGHIVLEPDSSEAMQSFSIGGELSGSVPYGELEITSGSGSYGL